MAELRELTEEKVSKLASRPKVRRVAVENFLMTVHYNKTSSIAIANLRLDARLYKWNDETVRAISDGIKMAEE